MQVTSNRRITAEELDVEDEDEVDYAWLKAVLAERSEQFQRRLIRFVLLWRRMKNILMPPCWFVHHADTEGRFARVSATKTSCGRPNSVNTSIPVSDTNLRIELGKEQNRPRPRSVSCKRHHTLADIQAAKFIKPWPPSERNGDDNSALTAHRAA